MNDTLDLARDLLAYIDASPTPWHCAAHSAERLKAAGFREQHEEQPIDLKPGEGGYILRDGAIFAFRLGLKPPAESGFRLIGAHTDSPNLRLKPNPTRKEQGESQLVAEIYGGVLAYTWLDRDLGIAGRVYVLDHETRSPKARFIDLRRPLCRIPSLAIHLQQATEREALKLNLQEHFPALFTQADDQEGNPLLTLLSEELQVPVEDILSWELALCDVVPPTLGGLKNEYIFSPRLDNQASCHAALVALIQAGPSDATQFICLYDHEECGSGSATGAEGPLTELLLRRLALGEPWQVEQERSEVELFQRAASRSWHLSSDMAHAVHPNWAGRHEPNHRPYLNKGPVIKSNPNQRYATDGEGAAWISLLCREADIPFQRFVARSDMGCGTTIGPIASSRFGVRTIDIGNPMLSMHSLREQAGSHDVVHMVTLMRTFLKR